MTNSSPCLPSIGEPCGECPRCRFTASGEIRHCAGCGQDYDPHEESHAGHEADPPTIFEALHDVHRHFCASDQHDPACRVLYENLAGSPRLSDEERFLLSEILRREGFYATKVRARILDIFDAALAVRRKTEEEW